MHKLIHGVLISLNVNSRNLILRQGMGIFDILASTVFISVKMLDKLIPNIKLDYQSRHREQKVEVHEGSHNEARSNAARSHVFDHKLYETRI